MKTADAEPRKPTRREARRAQRKAGERFARARNAAHDYAVRLKQVARAVASIVNGFAPKGIVGEHFEAMTAALENYAHVITPWARAVSRRMLEDVARRDAKAWHAVGETIGRSLRAEIRDTDVGQLMRDLQAAQVDLITSMSRKAAGRVHTLVREAQITGERAETVAEKIAETGRVTMNRALLIAHTEVGRAAGLLTQARAMSIGSEGYHWRTSRDADVRCLHRKLEGKFIPWNQPPIAGTGKGGIAQRYHAGCGPRCRCWMDVVLPPLD